MLVKDILALLSYHYKIIMGLVSNKIAIDFGSGTTRVSLGKKGVVVTKATALAVDEQENKIIAYGQEALDMAGRSPESITVIYPLKSGVIADYNSAKLLLKNCIRETLGPIQLKKPEAMITVSASATSTEKRALIDAGKEAGLKSVYLIKNPVAAALGVGLPITEPKGSIVVDIGKGTTEIGVFSLGGAVSGAAIRLGGNNIDEAIQRFMRREHGILIGQDETKRIKKDFVDLGGESTTSLAVHGRSIHQGTPKTATIKLGQLNPYIESVLQRVIVIMRKVMERTPPDILSDVIHGGVVLSGGSSQLKGLDSFLSKKLNVAFIPSDEPELATVKGAQAAINHLDEYRKNLVS